MKESISKSTMGFMNTSNAQPQTMGMNPVLSAQGLRGTNSIPYVAAPPLSSLDQSSLLLANQLNNIAISNNNNNTFSSQNPGLNIQQVPQTQYNAAPAAANYTNYTNDQQSGLQFNPNVNPQMYTNAPLNNAIPTSNFLNPANNFPQVNMENGITGVNAQNGLVNPNFYK